jgi:hypothetical protein
VEARPHRRCGPGDLAWEIEIGWACELQWVTAVGHGGALGALDRGWEAAAAAVDDEQ